MRTGIGNTHVAHVPGDTSGDRRGTPGHRILRGRYGGITFHLSLCPDTFTQLHSLGVRAQRDVAVFPISPYANAHAHAYPHGRGRGNSHAQERCANPYFHTYSRAPYSETTASETSTHQHTTAATHQHTTAATHQPTPAAAHQHQSPYTETVSTYCHAHLPIAFTSKDVRRPATLVATSTRAGV